LSAADVTALLHLLCEHAFRIEDRLPSWNCLPRGDVATLLNRIDAAADAPSIVVARLEALERGAVDAICLEVRLSRRLTELEREAAELRDTLRAVLASGRRRKLTGDTGPAAPAAPPAVEGASVKYCSFTDAAAPADELPTLPAAVDGAALNNGEIGPSPIKQMGKNGQGELSGAVPAVDAGPGKVPESAGPVSKVDAVWSAAPRAKRRDNRTAEQRREYQRLYGQRRRAAARGESHGKVP
jgi:hypothetical protein